jgi:Predicted acetyltransferase
MEQIVVREATEKDCKAVFRLNRDALGYDFDLESTRRQGVGAKLLHAVEEWAKSTGAAGVRLVSGYSRTGAHRFYEALGYSNRKDQKNFVKYF